MSKLWTKAFKNMYDFSKKHMAYYISGPQGGDLLLLLLAITNAGFLLKHTLVWVKNNHVLGRADYNYKHEPIAYGWKPDGTHSFYGGFDVSVFEDQADIDKMDKTELREALRRAQEELTRFDDVIREDKPLKNDLHPTMKITG